MLEIRDAWKRYGRVAAVAGVSLHLPRGELRALIGPNGAGKTTLLNLVTGQAACDQGVVLFRESQSAGCHPIGSADEGSAAPFRSRPPSAA